MNNFLDIRIYRKGDSSIGVVFKKRNVLYRITTVIEAREFANEMRGYYSHLSKGGVVSEYVYKIICPRKRHRYLEVALEQGMAVLNVYELIGADDLKLRFCWKGTEEEFLQVLRHLDVLIFLMRLV